MTEIEKMFDSIGLKKQYCGWLDMGDLDCQPQYVRCNSFAERKDAVFSSRFGESEEEPEHKYPPFTAEKQLELIKWLMINTKDYQYDVEDNKFWFYIDDCRETKYREFDEALAELINLYWQSLTNQEKEEIRNILNA